MDWLIFSLAGAASLAVTGIIDKFILARYVRDPHAYLAALIILQQIFAVGIILFAGPGFTYPYSLYAVAVGGLQVPLWTSYLRALQKEETSRVAALAYVFPVFVFLGSFLFLGEILTPKDYAGGFLLVLSSLLISYRPAPSGGRMILSPALKYMASFWIFTAAYAVASKYLLDFMDEWHLILWSSFGSLLFVLPLLAQDQIRREAFRYYHSGPFLFSALLADELFDFLGRASFIFAYALGSVALVSSVAALQPFITLIYVILLGLFMPGILKEELDSRTLALKVSALFLIVAGVYLVS
ncbi:EamA-like transporter family protein [uncultured archaeon]|nr:EamA-like transporter family protein [uncultured archaeon]